MVRATQRIDLRFGASDDPDVGHPPYDAALLRLTVPVQTVRDQPIRSPDRSAVRYRSCSRATAGPKLTTEKYSKAGCEALGVRKLLA